MDAGEIAAYVAAAVALIVGLINPAMAARSQRKQREHERTELRREEMVRLLEDAAIAMDRGSRGMERIEDLWRLGVSPDADFAHKEITERDSAVEEARAAYSRLLLRFPKDHPVPLSYVEATNGFDRYMDLLRGYTRGEEYDAREGEIRDEHNSAVTKESEFLETARAETARHEPE